MIIKVCTIICLQCQINNRKQRWKIAKVASRHVGVFLSLSFSGLCGGKKTGGRRSVVKGIVFVGVFLSLCCSRVFVGKKRRGPEISREGNSVCWCSFFLCCSRERRGAGDQS